jgi:integrase
MTDKQLHKYLDAEASQFQKEVENGMFIDANKTTFENFSDRWMEDYAKIHLQPKTIAEYSNYLRRINQAIGHIKLNKLQPHHLAQFYNNLKESGVRLDRRYSLNETFVDFLQPQLKELALNTGINVSTLKNIVRGNVTIHETAEKLRTELGIKQNKIFTEVTSQDGLNPKTILHHHRLISSILNKAIKWGIIFDNPASRVEPPKLHPTEAQCYDENQVSQMFVLLSKEPLKYQCAVYIALYGGLRLGEVSALDWNDINFDEKTITINKSRQYIPGIGSFDKSPKTERSKRQFQLSIGVLDILREHKNEQESERERIGDKWQENGKIFTQWNGVPIFPQTPSKWFDKWLRRTGLPKITFHQLRHSHASILIANGVDIATVSKQLGHAKISITINTYTHAIKSKSSVVADKLDDLLTPNFRSADE